MRYDVEFFCASVLLDIDWNLYEGKRRRALRGVCLHLDSAPAHNPKRSQEITRTKTTRVVHPAHSHDISVNGFFLFGCLHGEMAGFTANSPADILSEIGRIFCEISKETLAAVYHEWITLLE
jgi:hypothetical protein